MGEEVKKLDLLANDNFIDALSNCEKVCCMVSEENGEIIPVQEENINGPYVVAFDPLDGSSNIDVAVPVGSIWSIYKRKTDPNKNKQGTIEDALQSGENIVAAGYAMYGSCTQIINATAKGVNGYTLDPVSGEFILSHPNMQVPKRGSVYSVNEGNASSWNHYTSEYVQTRKTGGKQYSLRYVGSMVADIHRTLLIGGIFMYPADKKSPNGKLRLLYEVNPMSYIMERAGGKSVIGLNKRALEHVPKQIHERVPIYCGSSDDVDEVLSFMK
jgi:fructose-1,6-bisphosphatase I